MVFRLLAKLFIVITFASLMCVVILFNGPCYGLCHFAPLLMLILSYNVGTIVAGANGSISSGHSPTAAPSSAALLSMDLNEEKKLVMDAQTNTESFGKLYDYYFPKVYAFVASRLADRADAEDMVSEIFMKVLENLRQFEWRGVPFGAWIFRIARNCLNDFYQRSGRTRTADLEEARGVHEAEEKTSPHLKAASEELAQTVQKVLKDLPERELNVVQLKFFCELSNREIRDATGLSESNVAVILYRTLRRIKPDLQYFS